MAKVELRRLIEESDDLNDEEKNELLDMASNAIENGIDSFEANLGTLEMVKLVRELSTTRKMKKIGGDLIHELSIQFGEEEVPKTNKPEIDNIIQQQIDLGMEIYEAEELTAWLNKEGLLKSPDKKLIERYFLVYNALKDTPASDDLLEWTDVIVRVTKEKPLSYVSLTLSMMEDEADYEERPWRDKANMLAYYVSMGYIEGPKTFGPLQVHITNAREIAKKRGENMNDEELVEMLEGDKAKAASYYMELIEKITSIYAPDGHIDEERFQFIRADVLAGTYASKNAALQKQLVELGFMEATYNDKKIFIGDQSNIDGHIGDNTYNALLDFAKKNQIVDENGQPYTKEKLKKDYFSRNADRLSFNKTKLYETIENSYKKETKQDPPREYVTEILTRGGLWSSRKAIERSLNRFRGYNQKLREFMISRNSESSI